MIVPKPPMAVRSDPGHSEPRGGRFATTDWSMVLSAGSQAGAQSADALARLCEVYWYPVYVFVRREGYSADESADLTQGFFARMLEKSSFSDASPERGRFRSFLLACLRHFLSNERDRARRLKRGGEFAILSMEARTAEGRYLLEPRDELTPDKVFDRRWAETLLDRTLARLRDEHVDKGKRAVFDELKGFLTGDATGVSYDSLAKVLGSTEGATKVAVHRLRRRFRDLLFEEIGATVADPGDVEDEIRHLLRAIR